MPFLGLLLSRSGLTLMAVALVAAVIGVQTARLDHAKGDLTGARTALTAARGQLTTSEQNRDAEHKQATDALSATEAECSARVAQAHRSADRVRTLVEKPHATDPKTGCPIRSILHAGELRGAVGPGA